MDAMEYCYGRSKYVPSPNSINKVRRRLRFGSRSPSPKPRARVCPYLKGRPGSKSLSAPMRPVLWVRSDLFLQTEPLDLSIGHRTPTMETFIPNVFQDAVTPPPYRWPYDPVSEPFNPEAEEHVQLLNNDIPLDGQMSRPLLTRRINECLDDMVTLGEDYERNRLHFVPPREEENYPS